MVDRDRFAEEERSRQPSVFSAIQNAFVYIKDTLSEYTFDVPTKPVVLDQVGCRYTPRIFGVRVGQPVEMINSDATMHNVQMATPCGSLTGAAKQWVNVSATLSKEKKPSRPA